MSIRKTAALLTVAALAALPAVPAGATAAATPTLPGPPPGAGTGLPPAPAPGAPLPAGPVGPPAAIPGNVRLPSLLGAPPPLRGQTLTLTLACRSGGSAALTDPAIRKGILARGRYTCTRHRATVALTLNSADARRVRAHGPTIAGVSAGAGRFSVTLSTRAVKPSFWRGAGLQCNVYGPYTPYLVAPNFTLTPPAAIDVRPWVAFYTSGHGWQWLGTGGVNRSRWYQWTASPRGVLEWYSPAGARNPWTWAPITVRARQNTYAIGVFEVEYLYHHPYYVWRFAPSQLVNGAYRTYCAFP